MNHKTAIAVAGLAVIFATPLAAQGFVGAELGIEVFGFSEDTNLGYTSYSGAIEYGITRNIDVALDLGYFGLNSSDDNVSNATLHGIYHMSDTASLGAFIGRDNFDGGDVDHIGIEGGVEFMGAELEGFIGRIDDGSESGTAYGISGEYGFTDSFAAIGELKGADLGGDTLTRAAIGAQYQFNGGPAIYAQVGTIDVGTANETFVTLGATIALGSQRGTTFESRSLLDIAPGF